MLKNCLVLGVCILSIILSVGLLFLCSNLLLMMCFDVEDNEEMKKKQNKVFLYAGALLIIFAGMSYHAGRHLVVHAPYFLEQFTIWYSIGLLSRMVLLLYRRQLLDPVLSTDYVEVIFAFFVALRGPIETILLVKRLFTERNWFDE